MPARGMRNLEEKRSGCREAAAGAAERTANESNQPPGQHNSQGCSAAEQVLQEVAADYTGHYFHKERGGKAVLITAKQTASQGNPEATAGQQTGSNRKSPSQ